MRSPVDCALQKPGCVIPHRRTFAPELGMLRPGLDTELSAASMPPFSANSFLLPFFKLLFTNHISRQGSSMPVWLLGHIIHTQKLVLPFLLMLARFRLGATLPTFEQSAPHETVKRLDLYANVRKAYTASTLPRLVSARVRRLPAATQHIRRWNQESGGASTPLLQTMLTSSFIFCKEENYSHTLSCVSCTFAFFFLHTFIRVSI